ncbi:transposase [Escherichia coli]|nr:transposase [Escherichia coli]
MQMQHLMVGYPKYYQTADYALRLSVMADIAMKWHTEFGHLNRGDMLTSEQHRCSNEKKKFQRRV